MDATALYLGYCELGRETFLARAAPALVVRGVETNAGSEHARALDVAATHAAAGVRASDGTAILVHPLIKRPDTPFAHMITVGRTGNNDVCVPDASVSRFHAYFRDTDGEWLVCDAGSRNGTRLNGRKLATRAETPLGSGSTLRIGDVTATFCTPPDLYALLIELSFADA